MVKYDFLWELGGSSELLFYIFLCSQKWNDGDLA